MENIFEEIDGLPSEKAERFKLGKFDFAFLDKDPVFIKKLLPLIETSLPNERFQTTVMCAYTENYMNEKAAILKEFGPRRDAPDAVVFYTLQLDLVCKQLAVKTIQQLTDYLKNDLNEYPGRLEILNNFYKSIHGEDGSSYIKGNYVNYRIGRILYSRYQRMRKRIDMLALKYSRLVECEYKKIGIDIRQEDTQFCKYSLVSLNENIQVLNDKEVIPPFLA
jgi:hypothetical protein